MRPVIFNTLTLHFAPLPFTADHRRPIPLIGIVSFVLLVSACTQVARPEAQPLPHVETVALVSDGPTEELRTRFGVTPDNSSVGMGAGVGAGAGAGASRGSGAGWASVTVTTGCSASLSPAT